MRESSCRLMCPAAEESSRGVTGGKERERGREEKKKNIRKVKEQRESDLS